MCAFYMCRFKEILLKVIIIRLVKMFAAGFFPFHSISKIVSIFNLGKFPRTNSTEVSSLGKNNHQKHFGEKTILQCF